MTFVGADGYAMSPVGTSRGAVTRGRIQNGVGYGMAYPNPFFDVAHTYLPTSIKSLFHFTRYYFMTNGFMHTTAYKAALYPITDTILEHEDLEVQKKWTTYWHEHLRWRPFQVEIGLDKNVYGNSFVTISYPFNKYLRCKHCGYQEEATRIKQHWSFVAYEFRLTCPKCHHVENAEVSWINVRNASGIRLVRWNPEDIDIAYNEVTGEYQYYYNMSKSLRNDIVMGKKDVVATIPQVYITAAKEGKSIKFAPGQIFHMKRPSLADTHRGWGIPQLLPVLKDAFGMQVLKKSHETILLEHILPLRTIFPQAASGSSDPFSSVSLVDWRDHVAKEIAQWRADPNYIPILPLPIGQQTIGGDGRSLLLTPEIQQAAEHLVVGMGYPKEFIWGGASWAGTNVSMRMVENMFIGDISDHLALAKWVMQQISTYMEWPKALIRFKPFRMADDLQRKALMLQVNQANKLSDTSLMAELDYDQNEENKIMIREADTRIEATKRQQLAMADIQGESQLIMAKYQAKAQQVQQQAMAAGQAPGEPGGPEQQSAGGAPGGDGGAPAQLPAELQQGTQEAPQAQSQAMPDPQTPYAGQTPQQPGLAQQQSGLDIVGMAQMHARMIASMPPEQQQQAIQNLQTQSPELAALVMQMLQGMQGQQPQADASGVAASALPEQRAPRRDYAK